MAGVKAFSLRKTSMIVRILSPRATRGRLVFGPLDVSCALGRSGMLYRKREGDGATPAGRFRIVEGFYRADRIVRPKTALPLRRLRTDDGWCDDPRDGRYNRRVRLPFAASHEALWRADHVYDVIVVLDHNTRPRVRGAGSAVFLHLTRPGYQPTEGCVAVSPWAMRQILRRVRMGDTIGIG